MRSWLRRHYANIALGEVDTDVKTLDIVLAALLALASAIHVLGVLQTDAYEIHWPIGQILADLIIASIVPFRRRWPLASLWLGVTTSIAWTCLHLGHAGEVNNSISDLNQYVTAGTVASFLILLYSAVRWTRADRLWIAAGALALVALSSSILTTDLDWGSIAQSIVNWGFVAAIAIAMRYRASLQRQAEQERRLSERQSLARELHDVVAHHVSAIAVQAQAAQAVASNNPQAALDSLRNIETTASLTLREMRRMVGILRDADVHSPMVGTLTLQDLADEPGTPAIRLRGADLIDTDVPLAVNAALIRIAQESITNARRHGSDLEPIDIVVSIYQGEISMVITNSTTNTKVAPGGFGIIGMSERAASLGGSLLNGPLPDQRWRVNARMPIGRSSHTAQPRQEDETEQRQ